VPDAAAAASSPAAVAVEVARRSWRRGGGEGGGGKWDRGRDLAAGNSSGGMVAAASWAQCDIVGHLIFLFVTPVNAALGLGRPSP
jgi:hypothetical protein